MCKCRTSCTPEALCAVAVPRSIPDTGRTFDMSLPDGYSPPAYANTPDDHGGWAIIASGVGLVFILLFASIRLYTRYPFRSRLLYDDVAIMISTVRLSRGWISASKRLRSTQGVCRRAKQSCYLRRVARPWESQLDPSSGLDSSREGTASQRTAFQRTTQELTRLRHYTRATCSSWLLSTPRAPPSCVSSMP